MLVAVVNVKCEKDVLTITKTRQIVRQALAHLWPIRLLSQYYSYIIVNIIVI